MIYRLRYLAKHPSKIGDELVWIKTRITSAYKRARYGYSAADMAIYGYDGTLMTWTGRAMMELTRYQHGYPPDYPSLEAWNQDCCFYGMCLVVGGDSDWSDEDIDWAKEAFPDLFYKYHDSGLQSDHVLMFRVSNEIGRIGLLWLADHYGSLWD